MRGLPGKTLNVYANDEYFTAILRKSDASLKGSVNDPPLSFRSRLLTHE